MHNLCSQTTKNWGTNIVITQAFTLPYLKIFKCASIKRSKTPTSNFLQLPYIYSDAKWQKRNTIYISIRLDPNTCGIPHSPQWIISKNQFEKLASMPKHQLHTLINRLLAKSGVTLCTIQWRKRSRTNCKGHWSGLPWIFNPLEWGKVWKQAKDQDLIPFYIDNGRSILRFFFLASLTCFVIFMHKSNSTVTQTNIKASWMCLKYKETAEKTRKAKIISSHITKTTTSTLHPENN